MSGSIDRQSHHAESFQESFARIAGSMHVLAAALVGRSDAPDVVQEACIIALRRFAEFQSTPVQDPGRAASGFQAWMAQIVRNVSSNHQRGNRRRALRLRLWSSSRTAEVDPPPSDPRTIDPALLEAVESLEENARACLLLRVVQGLSYEAIATTLSMPEATVRSHVYRARNRLVQHLDSRRSPDHE